ncbi:MAG: hypothetical protein V1647_00050 [Pseudomonadota bacterium]
MINKEICEYCELCGGCDFVGVPYARTLDIKLNNFKVLIGIKGVTIEGSPSPLNYRTRCQLQIGNGKAGFFRKKTHDLIEIKKCALLDERLNKRISELKLPENYNGKIELYIKHGAVCERVVEKKYDNRFTQVNEKVNALLIKEVVKSLELTPGDNILELYCGSGNLTYAILDAEPKIKITGIDLKIEKGKKSAADLIEAEVEKGLLLLDSQRRLRTFNKLLLDPPRAGVSKSALEVIGAQEFERIVYVSCSPEAFVRDKKILEGNGYKVRSAKLFDMFPFTQYVEAVAVLTKLS